MMKILVERTFRKSDYTIGRLYVNGQFWCNTLEDTDRGLSSSMSVEEIKLRKVYGQTAIPTGKYEVGVTYSPKFRKMLPILLDVPCFSGIRIHAGNTAADTAGCILPGMNTKVGMVTSSSYWADKLGDAISTTMKLGQSVIIEIR